MVNSSKAKTNVFGKSLGFALVSIPLLTIYAQNKIQAKKVNALNERTNELQCEVAKIHCKRIKEAIKWRKEARMIYNSIRMVARDTLLQAKMQCNH